MVKHRRDKKPISKPNAIRDTTLHLLFSQYLPIWFSNAKFTLKKFISPNRLDIYKLLMCMTVTFVQQICIRDCLITVSLLFACSSFIIRISRLRTQDSGQVYSTENYTWKYYIRITLQNNTSMLNKYGPDIIKNAEMRVGRPLLRS